MDNNYTIKFDSVNFTEKTKKQASSLFVRLFRKFSPQYLMDPRLENINITIRPNQIVALISNDLKPVESFIKLLAGEVRPSSGSISVEGIVPNSKAEGFQKLISFVGAEPTRLWIDLSTKEVINLIQTRYDISQSDLDQRIVELTEMLGIKDILKIQVRKLSVENQLKCEIFLALLHEPKILVLNDITKNIDEAAKRQIRKFIKELNLRHKTTIILATDVMEDIAEVGTNIVIFEDKKIVYQGPISALLNKYANYKYLHLKFEKEISREDLALYGELKHHDLMEAVLSIPREGQGRISSDVLTHLPVSDMQVKEPPLADVIQDILEARKQVNENELKGNLDEHRDYTSNQIS